MKDKMRDDGVEGMDDLVLDNSANMPSRSTPTTASVLGGLDTIRWEIARMKDVLRKAPPGVVTTHDAKAFHHAFRRIERESDALASWLRCCVLEAPRN